MKKLRSILSALATLRRVPSAAIFDAWQSIKQISESATMNDTGDKAIAPANIDLIDQILGAVISLAKDDEDKAAAPGKSDKP